MSFALHIGADGLDDERLLRFRELAEIDVEILQRLVVGIDVVVFVVGFAEQIVGRGVEDVRDLDHLFERGAGTPDLPAADGGLLYAEFVGQFTLRSVVLLAESFKDLCKHTV